MHSNSKLNINPFVLSEKIPCRDSKNEFELAMENELTVFELLTIYCILNMKLVASLAKQCQIISGVSLRSSKRLIPRWNKMYFSTLWTNDRN